MQISNKRYFQEDLNSDDGTKWKKMLCSVIDKANFMEFYSVIVGVNDDLQIKITEAKEHIRQLGFSKNLIEIYATNTLDESRFIVVRLNLDSKIRKKISSYKTLVDLALSDDEIYDPAFYFNKMPLLQAITTGVYANLLLSDTEKLLWQKTGFSFDINNGIEFPRRFT